MVMGTGGVAMKHKSLFKNSMVLIIVPFLILSIIVIIVSQNFIQDYFANESYTLLRNEIDRQLETFENSDKNRLALSRLNIDAIIERLKKIDVSNIQDFKPVNRVRTMILVEIDESIRPVGSPQILTPETVEELKVNTVWPYEGSYESEDETVFFAISQIDKSVISRLTAKGEIDKVYVLSYISESYSKDLTAKVVSIFGGGLLILVIIVILVLFFVFRKISRRLRVLEEGTNKIGGGQLKITIPTIPEDEIGRLGGAMNRMGKQLSLIQEEQAESLQTISHELKTPIMVLQGYMDALIKDQYPNGSKEATYRIITDELEKLERMTKNLVRVNKVDYLARNNVDLKPLKLSELFHEAVMRLETNNLDIQITGEHELVGDKNSWMMVIENILTNQLRYANTYIHVVLSDYISVKNDGETIDDRMLDNIMAPFVKGKLGKSGLGLTIINNILKLYHYGFKIKNHESGVEYYIFKYED